MTQALVTRGAGGERELKDRITEGDVDKALAAIREGLEAKQLVRGPKGNDEGLSYVEVIDFSTRLAAAKLLLDIKFPKEKGQRNKLVVNLPVGNGTMSETALRAIADRYTQELPSAAAPTPGSAQPPPLA